MRSRIAQLVTTLILANSMSPALTYAETGDTLPVGGLGTITIDQIIGEGEQEIFGEWSLIHPNNEHTTSDNQHFELTKTRVGVYTFAIDPPEGAGANVELLINGVADTTQTRQQITFTMDEGKDIQIRVTFNYNRVGSVTVNSKPVGLSFTLKGPDDRTYTGTTPDAFEDSPEGLYTVYFDEIEGCATPKPKSDRLKKDGRVNLTVTFECDKLAGLDAIKDEQRALEYVTVTLDNGTRIIFDDAPVSAWYATYVFKAAKTGIITGYKDDSGNYSGIFGPGNNVTLAELAKIAHEISGIDETKIRVEPQNVRARETWFADYYASAEQRYWQVFQSALDDPGRPATRAEVIATLLQAMDVPLGWAKGSMFADVNPLIPYAFAIETAANDGVIAGYTNADGSLTGFFGPEDPINRAELSKILSLVIEKYGENTPEILGDNQR